MSPLTPRRAALALAATSACALVPTAALAAAPADPSAARPNTYEQITRAPGAAGATKLEVLTTPEPLFASDLGIVAAYDPNGRSNFSLQVPLPATTLRNTVTNQNDASGSDRGRLVGADRLELNGLFQRLVKVDEYTYDVKYAIGRVDGHGPLRDLPIDGNGGAQVRLSGNGRYVISSNRDGLRRLDVLTGKFTQLAPFGYLGKFAVSDDGQTVGAIDFDQAAQRVDAVVYRGTKKVVLVQGYNYGSPGAEPQISPDGSTAFTLDPAQNEGDSAVVTAHKLATGTTVSSDLPFQKVWSTAPIWVSPTGDRIAFADGYQDADSGPLEPAQAWTVGGSWQPFGGAFATSLTSKDSLVPTSAISRNGRYAAVAFNDQVALVSLEGTPLLGNVLGRDALAATAYLDTPGLDYCGFGFSSSISASFTRPAPWAPAPRSAHIAIGDGTQLLQEADWTKPEPHPITGDGGDYDFILVHFPNGTPHTRTVDFTVVDGNGRTVREQQTLNVTCKPAF